MSYSLVHQTEQLLVRNTSVGMVCAVEEANAVCILKDNTGKISPPFFLPPSSTIEDLLNHVQLLVSYNPDSFEVLIVDDFSKTVVPNGQETKDRSAKEIGVRFQPDVTNCFEVCPKFQDPPSIVISPVPHVEEKSDDSSSNVPPNLTSGRVIDKSSAQYNPSWDVEAAVYYVGLVNQAMTCYLNSLLQALYMTPEFRNALYKWEFVGSREEMHKSIPYQLQRLFLNLQTSKRSAVETTKLTRSFGWDSSEAWQQHDIQELCRVMFDALEQKFHNTDQADFINNLYEGKMIDYVKCLECKTEKFREDTFLDIPLPVRPFGSTVAYNSIEEALQAFVQPETLDGNNQYFCEKCNKKCDAHKGLKFSRFPYVLTLHLKRFDFDYSTMHRIKLNDKVEFPQTLNLNSFISQAVCDVGPEVQEKNHNCSNKGDDVMTDDEGCQGTDSTDTPENTHSSTSGSNSSGSNADMQEYDEGIDLSNGISNLQQQENEKNRRHMSAAGLPEPYIYELFSIMIHSGSASGGHYYAYIKDFNTRDWFCFNDQSVSRITNEDISKTYGGGANRVYYSGAHSSSTNAYMLMYRQIDVKRNVSAMSVDEFPPHLQELMMRMQEEEEEERIIRERDKERIKIKVYTRHPKDRRFLDTHLVVGSDTTLADATIIAHKLLFKDDVPLEQCRLVNYNSVTHTIECSFDDQDEEMIGDLLARLPGMNSLFLEVRDRNARFEAYSPGRVVITVHVVHMDSGAVDFPLELPTDMTTTVKMFKSKLADSLRLPMNMRIITEDCNPTLLEDDKTLKSAGFYSNNRIFVTSPPKIESDADFNRKLCKIVERFRNTIEVICTLPETDKESLAKLGITTVVMEANGMLNGDSEALEGANSTRSLPCGLSPLFPPATHLDGEEEALGAISCSDQSTSEDSSLTDSDRTIVGEEADYGLAELSSSSNSPQCSGAQNLSSPDEKDPVVRGKKMSLAVQDDWDDSDDKTGSSYFSMKPLDRQDQHRMALIAVDKRMTVGTFKGALAQHLGVAPECVKLFLECKNSEVEIISSKDQYISFRDQQHIIVRLERALREGELRGKVYQLILDDQHDGPVFLCDWILNKDMTVGQAKKQILDELKSKEVLDWTDIRCRLRSKKWKDPGKIYLDNMTFRMLKIESNWEMFLQELPDGETVEHPSSITVLVRRWFPSRLKLGDFLEVTITAGPEGGLEPELSKLTGIPEDSLGIARPSGGQFPYKLSKEQKEGTSEWHVGLPLDLKDGEVLFYRDMNEEQKPLSEQTECGNESSSRELKFVRDSGNISSREERRTYSTRKESKFSPRKERALKIYVDSPTPSPRAEE